MRIIFSSLEKPSFRPAIFIDRDGVINCKIANGYVLEWERFVFTPGIREALKELSRLPLPLIVISNQAAVGKGLLTADRLREITDRMHQSLVTDGILLTACYYCLHRAEDGCDCRKPKSGMIQQAADDLNVDLSRSIFIGDSETDVQAARAAGCRPVFFGPRASFYGNSLDGMEPVPVAPSAKDLFKVAVKCLDLS